MAFIADATRLLGLRPGILVGLILVAACGTSDSALTGDGGPDSVDAQTDGDGAIISDAQADGPVPGCDGDAAPASPPPPHGTFFEPANAPTPLYFEPPAERALLPCAINGELDVIATSEYHEFFILDGKLVALGGNRAGQMGIGDAIPAPYVTPRNVVVPAGTTFRAAAAGGYQSLGADSDGWLWSWGNNVFGARGDGTLTFDGNDNSQGVPVKLLVDKDGEPLGGPADPIVQVVSTLWYQVARSQSGQVYVWGLNGYDNAGSDSRGVIGDGQPVVTGDCTGDGEGPPSCYQTRPVRVRFPAGTRIRHVAASASMLVGVDEGGALWTWGGGGYNGVGLGAGDRGAQTQSSTPIKLTMGQAMEGGALGPLPRFVDATTNTETSYAVDEHGQLWGWGVRWKLLRMASTADFAPQARPVQLTSTGNPNYAALDARLAQGRKVVNVQVSLNSTHVLLDDGSLWGWGDAAMGEVGDGHIVNYLTVTPAGGGGNVIRAGWDWHATQIVRDPVQVMSDVRFFNTSAFSFHVMAVRHDGTIYSWGRNANGVLGNQLLTSDHTAPWYQQYAPISPLSYTPNLYDVPYPTWVQPF